MYLEKTLRFIAFQAEVQVTGDPADISHVSVILVRLMECQRLMSLEHSNHAMLTTLLSQLKRLAKESEGELRKVWEVLSQPPFLAVVYDVLIARIEKPKENKKCRNM